MAASAGRGPPPQQVVVVTLANLSPPRAARAASPPASPPVSPPRGPIVHRTASAAWFPAAAAGRVRARILPAAEYSRALLVSHNRRDPAALNATYAMVHALRGQRDPETGRPFSRHCFVGGDGAARTAATVELWTDKEQLATSAGADWQEPIVRAMLEGVATVVFVGNAFCGSDPCLDELRFCVGQGVQAIPVFLEPLHSCAADFDGWLAQRAAVPGHVISRAARRGFAEWRVSRGLAQFWTGKMQGVDAFFGPAEMECFLCAACRATRDAACERCTSWERLQALAVGPVLAAKVAQLGRYVDAAVDRRAAASVLAVEAEAEAVELSAVTGGRAGGAGPRPAPERALAAAGEPGPELRVLHIKSAAAGGSEGLAKSLGEEARI
jgi:hypothetical protein